MQWSLVNDGNLISSGSFYAIGPERDDVNSQVERQRDEILSQVAPEDAARIYFDVQEPQQRWIALNASVIMQILIINAGFEDSFPHRPLWILDESPRKKGGGQVDVDDSENFF